MKFKLLADETPKLNTQVLCKHVQGYYYVACIVDSDIPYWEENGTHCDPPLKWCYIVEEN